MSAGNLNPWFPRATTPSPSSSLWALFPQVRLAAYAVGRLFNDTLADVRANFGASPFQVLTSLYCGALSRILGPPWLPQIGMARCNVSPASTCLFSLSRTDSNGHECRFRPNRTMGQFFLTSPKPSSSALGLHRALALGRLLGEALAVPGPHAVTFSGPKRGAREECTALWQRLQRSCAFPKQSQRFHGLLRM